MRNPTRTIKIIVNLSGTCTVVALARGVIAATEHNPYYPTNPCGQEGFYTAPWFDGSAMYLRGEEYLYCIRETK